MMGAGVVGPARGARGGQRPAKCPVWAAVQRWGRGRLGDAAVLAVLGCPVLRTPGQERAEARAGEAGGSWRAVPGGRFLAGSSVPVLLPLHSHLPGGAEDAEAPTGEAIVPSHGGRVEARAQPLPGRPRPRPPALLEPPQPPASLGEGRSTQGVGAVSVALPVLCRGPGRATRPVAAGHLSPRPF